MSIKDKNNILIISVITIIGFIWRIYHLAINSYWLDESYNITAAQAIATNGYPLLKSGIIHYHEILNNYLLAFNSLIFGQTALAYRLSSVLFGTATIIVVYLLAKKLFNNKVGIISALFISIANWQIVWSRQAKGHAGLQFFYLVSAYFLLKLWQNFNKKDYILFTITAILAWLCHDLGIILLPLGNLALLIKYRQNIKSKVNYSNIRKYWIIYLIGLTTIATISFFGWPLISETLNKQDWLAVAYTSFLFKYHLFIITGALSGLLYLYIKKQKTTTSFLLWFWLLPLLITISATDILQFRYIFHFYPLMVILTVYIITEIIEPLKNNWLKTIIAIIILLLGNINMLVLWPRKHYQLEPLTPQANFKQAYEKINEIKTTNDIIISPYTCLDNIYFGQTDYWLKISFSNKPKELENYINFPYDLYHKTPEINDFTELKNITNQNHGFIILDGMANNRLGNEFFDNLSSNYKQIIFQDGNYLNKLWVFQF